MFCEKCGREIPEDSLFCNYCGVPVPEEMRETDWEEAARRREAREQEPSARRNPENGRYAPGCVAPGASKKKCTACGRELPSSTVGDLCTLCKMRRKREEEAREEQAAEARYEQEIAQGKRDRYDVSDEFDWGALNQGTSSGSAWKPDGSAQAPEKKRMSRGCLAGIILFAVCLILPVLFAFVPWLLFSVNRSDESYGIVSVDRVLDGEAAVSAEDSLSALEDEYETAPGWAGEYDWEPVRDAEAFGTWVRPVAERALDEVLFAMPEQYTYLSLQDPLMEADTEWFTAGILNRVIGSAAVLDGDGELLTIPFDLVVVVCGEAPDPEGAGYVLSFTADGEVLFSDMEAVDSEGRITEYGESVFGGDAGTFPYGEPPKDLSAEAF